MIFFDLQKLCSIYKIVVNVEVILAIIVALLTSVLTHGLSIVYLALFIFLTFIPQYIFVEMGLLIDKLSKNQNKEEE